MQRDFEQLILVAEITGLDKAPTRFKLLSWGRTESTKGDYIFDDESAKLIMDDYRRRGVDLVIDYEHTTVGGEFARPDRMAPASGWIKALESVPGDGLYAQVAWTDEARELLNSSKYRYFSPVTIVRKADRKAVGLHSAALTNKPATLGIAALVNKDSDVPEGHRVNDPRGASFNMERHMKDQLIAKLALSDKDASDDAVMTALDERLTLAEQADADRQRLTLVCKELGLAPDAKPEAIEAKLLALKTQTPPEVAEAMTTMQGEIKALRDADDSRKVETLIASAQKEGRILTSQMEQVKKIADRAKAAGDLTILSDALAMMPVQRPQGRTEAPADPLVTSEGDGDRPSTIRMACKEWESANWQVSKAAYVNEVLSEKGLKRLDKDEVEKLS